MKKIRDLEKWQKHKLIIWFLVFSVFGIVYLSCTSAYLSQSRRDETEKWENNLTQNEALVEEMNEISEKGNATKVNVGTYVEDVKNISVKDGSFKVVMVVWFNWKYNDQLDFSENFRIYRGVITNKHSIENYAENGEFYQSFRIEATVTRNFKTTRFPLESHPLKIYIEPTYPVSEVVFTADQENSTYNPGLDLSGYEIKDYETGIFYQQYATTENAPGIDKAVMTTEHLTAIRINRSGLGAYLRCFVALFGTTLWVMIVLYICTFHRVDPLSMIPAALFGTVSNIMVGANLVPEALDAGLIEFVNIWGVCTILAITLAVININRIRNKFEDRAFAKLFGQIMFFTIFTIVITGHILLPVSAYLF